MIEYFSARAQYEVPDGITDLMHQRRRHNNTKFVVTAAALVRLRLWFSRAVFFQIFNLLDLIGNWKKWTKINFAGAYLMPVNAILLLSYLWQVSLVEMSKLSYFIKYFHKFFFQIHEMNILNQKYCRILRFFPQHFWPYFPSCLMKFSSRFSLMSIFSWHPIWMLLLCSSGTFLLHL